MSPYIKNLTDHLIGNNGYDFIFNLSSEEFRKHVALSLYIGDINHMKPAKLGEIIAAFDIGDVMASKEKLFDLVHFAGDCDDMLRTLACACLSYAIHGRLRCYESYGMPPYIRSTKAVQSTNGRRIPKEPTRAVVENGRRITIDDALDYVPTMTSGCSNPVGRPDRTKGG
jgi:hypothetical protein